jgi:nucleoside-diphosphate-sugar epimerase
MAATTTAAVAGAAGRLGAKLTRALLAHGYTVRALCRRGGDWGRLQYGAVLAAGATAVELAQALQGMVPTAAFTRVCMLTVAARRRLGVDVVVSALSGPVLFSGQRQLLAACKTAQIKVFVPSELGADLGASDYVPCARSHGLALPNCGCGCRPRVLASWTASEPFVTNYARRACHGR